MMDRTIPFFNTILRCDEPEFRKPVLPEGYTFKMYTAGDEKAWARLEREIGDFDTADEAEAYFRDAYLYAGSDIGDRCVFAVNPEGQIVGSCIALRDRRGNGTVASLHWLVVAGAYRGMGLGKALCEKVLGIFADRGEFPVYIHTQPRSYKAIVLYIREGFSLQRSDTFSHYENQYTEAMDTLKTVLPGALYRELADNTRE